MKDESSPPPLPDLSITPPESPLLPRLGAMESSSSKKMTQGAAALARANTARGWSGGEEGRRGGEEERKGEEEGRRRWRVY